MSYFYNILFVSFGVLYEAVIVGMYVGKGMDVVNQYF